MLPSIMKHVQQVKVVKDKLDILNQKFLLSDGGSEHHNLQIKQISFQMQVLK